MDAIISALGGDYVFGDRQVTRNGISIALMPSNPKISDWGIIDYPLHALIGLKQDYMRYGDLSTSLMFKERIIQQLALYESVQDVNGFLTATPPTSGFIPGWSRKWDLMIWNSYLCTNDALPEFQNRSLLCTFVEREHACTPL